MSAIPDKGTEYEFTLPDGSKRYEIVFAVKEIHDFMRLHRAIKAEPVRHTEE
jgi:hypothetical protein